MSRGIGLVFANGSYELLRDSAPHPSSPRSSSLQYGSPHCSVGLGVARYCIARYAVAPDSRCTAVELERGTSDFDKVPDETRATRARATGAKGRLDIGRTPKNGRQHSDSRFFVHPKKST